MALAVRERAQKAMDKEGLEILLGMMRNKRDESEDRRYAIKMLMEYAYGKPQQYMDVTSAGASISKAYVDVDIEKVCE